MGSRTLTWEGAGASSIFLGGYPSAYKNVVFDCKYIHNILCRGGRVNFQLLLRQLGGGPTVASGCRLEAVARSQWGSLAWMRGPAPAQRGAERRSGFARVSWDVPGGCGGRCCFRTAQGGPHYRRDSRDIISELALGNPVPAVLIGRRPGYPHTAGRS